MTTPATALPPGHALALALICDRLPHDEINWALTGSTALALHRLPVSELADIDLQTDPRDWAEAERRLAEFVTRPVQLGETDRIRSHFGALSIHGVPVEIIGGVQRPAEHGWSTPIDPRDHRHLIDWNGRTVPVLDLAYEADAYDSLGRPERARHIRAWHAAHR